MATVVLVHGRAQEYTIPTPYEEEWRKAIHDGLQREPKLNRAVDLPRVKLAFYGDIRRQDLIDRERAEAEAMQSAALSQVAASSSGGTAELNDSPSDEDVTWETFGASWSAARSERRKGTLNPRRPQSTESFEEISSDIAYIQRIVNIDNILDYNAPLEQVRIGPFSLPLNLGSFTGKFDDGKFGEWIVRYMGEGVIEYLTNDDYFRDRVQERIDSTVSDVDDDIILVGYSLGSVAGYDWLTTSSNANRSRVKGYITFGSILGITLVRKKLKMTLGRPLAYPDNLPSWVNVLDLDDPATSGRALAPFFPSTGNQSIEDILTNGKTPSLSASKLMEAHHGPTYASSLEFRDALADLL